MILENFYGSGIGALANEYESTVIGEPSEIGEMVNECAGDMHGLTVALARFEHKCIVENAGMFALNEGVKEWFIKAKDFVVRMWKKFVAWVKSVYERIRTAVFGPRENWLKEHEKELRTFSKFGGEKVTLGNKLRKQFSVIMDRSSKINVVSREAETFAGGSQSEADFKSSVRAKLGNKTKDESYATTFRKEFVGDDKEVALSSALISELIDIVKDTAAAIELMPNAQKKAEAEIGMLETFATQASRDENLSGRELETAKRKIEGIRIAGTEYTSCLSALVELISSANGQAMRALVKAYSAGKSNLKESTGYGTSGNVLADFM